MPGEAGCSNKDEGQSSSAPHSILIVRDNLAANLTLASRPVVLYGETLALPSELTQPTTASAGLIRPASAGKAILTQPRVRSWNATPTESESSAFIVQWMTVLMAPFSMQSNPSKSEGVQPPISMSTVAGGTLHGKSV